MHKDNSLISPYGGILTNLISSDEERAELLARAKELPFIQISGRSLCELELLATGAFSPLSRFMDRRDYNRVLNEMRLANGMLFPVPVTLPVAENTPRAG